jgi:hypothetical protein
MLRSKSKERKRRSQAGSEDGVHPDDLSPTSPNEFESTGLYDQPNGSMDEDEMADVRANGSLDRTSTGRASLGKGSTLGRRSTAERMGSEEGDSGIAGDPVSAFIFSYQNFVRAMCLND